MSALSKKTRVTLLILAGALLLTVLGGFAVLYTVKSLSCDLAMNQYLTPYGEKATAEDFAAELSYLTVSIRFSGTHAVNVRFEKTPEGGLELTGWENADE